MTDIDPERFANLFSHPRAVTEYMFEVAKVLSSESDRGCVLVTSAYIEEGARRVLIAYCQMMSDVSDKDLSKLFKNFESQFASLASCIRLCRALGLMNDEQQRVLLDFGGWRNAFAHGTGDMNIKDVGTKFLSPIEEGLFIMLRPMHDVPAFNRHSLERQKFMVFASMFVATFHDLVLDLEASKSRRSPDAKSQ